MQLFIRLDIFFQLVNCIRRNGDYPFFINLKNFISVVAFFLLGTNMLWAGGSQLTNLKVEYAQMPLGIDVERPRFSWQMQADTNDRGVEQIAYRLLVKDEAGQLVWDSEKTKSNISLNIEYAGAPLSATTRYYWTVTVWDNRNNRLTANSWFETGLMNSGIDAWSGARWIGGGDEDMVLYAHYLPVFKVNYVLRLDEKKRSSKAAFVYGANDMRLMDQYKNIYHLANGPDSSYIAVELDISALASGGEAQLNIYRVGYHPADKKEVPFKRFPVPGHLINEKNKYDRHAIYLSSVLGYTQVYIGGEEKDHLVGSVNLNPLGRGGDFIAFPVLGDIGYLLAEGQSAVISDVQVRNFRSPSNRLTTGDFEWVVNDGGFAVTNPSRNASPMLRTSFRTGKTKIVKARLYTTARGIYDVYLNGRCIGTDYFNPGHAQYNKTHLYQTFDVTSYLKKGENKLGAVLAEGWWSGGATFQGEYWNYYGDRQSLLAKLVITYADGKTEVIISDPQKWQYANDGSVIYGSLFQGEVYDARKGGLFSPGIKWKPAVEVPILGYVAVGGELNRPAIDDFSGLQLIGQFGETVKKIKELTAVSMEEVRPGVFVYDMGQNMVGVPHITLKNTKPGTKIILRYAEVKYPDLPEYKNNKGELMLENIRAAMAQDIFITGGGKEEIIAPRFTFHGYRYVEITGVATALPPEAVKGTVLSSVHELASYYETSNPKVNQLWQNITWSTRGNFLSIPTDCPQRNERLGWSGDISVFARTATYLADVPQFLRRHMLAMRDAQREDGRFPDIAPAGGGFGGFLWGVAGLTVAWESYQQYSDKRLLSEHYDAMKRYTYLVQEKYIDKETGILVQEHPSSWANLGDWLGPEQEKNDNSLLWEAYYIFGLDIMKKVAAVLNKKSDEQHFTELYKQRKQFFNQTYIDKATGKTVGSGFQQNKKGFVKGKPVDTQTSYVLPLAFGIVDPAYKEKFIARFTETLTRENELGNNRKAAPYSLMTGFIGTAWISKALSDNGHTDAAYKLLQQTSYPSWLYPVEQGATTIWERLNSYTHTDGFGGNNGMNSFNHYSFGAVGTWMYNYSLGIERDEDSPGFKHFILRPEPDPSGKMSYAKGWYESMYGKIESSWEKKGNVALYRFIVPSNTTATLYLSAVSPDTVTENGKPFQSSKYIQFAGRQNGKLVFKLQSGTYHFGVK